MQRIFLCCLLGLIFFPLLEGCAAKKTKKAARSEGPSCAENSLEAAHVNISTHASAHKFNGCFANYMGLNDLNELDVNICAFLLVRPDGSVSNAKVTGNHKALSNDLKWCLEQEFWKMNYSKLQFDVPQRIKFPMDFEVRKNQ
ncbi:MAG: hypothetical protein WEB87_06335 [Bacteriovoracaceae bacterium]